MNPVLIETLWNVKIYSKRLAGYLLRINRNIVECKGELLTVLKKSEKRINRNIVECKVVAFLSAAFAAFCINRNIVECKVWT